jgi:hypothetical protein
MPETATLHIQARDSDPVRVVELPGASVRIGRAPFCEVLLPEPDLAEEECQLRRRGATWHLVPVAPTGAVTVDGRVVDRPRPLPYGVPLRVGQYSLTLRPSAATPPEWGAPVAAASSASAAAAAGSARPYRPHREAVATRVRPTLAEREKQWEARWKAAGERLVARPATPPPAPAAPVAEPPRPAERLAGWRSVDVTRREATPVAKVARPLDPSAFPSLRAVEVPSAYPAAARSAVVKRRPAPAPPPSAPRVPAALVPTPEDEAVFIPPSELDWEQAEVRHRAIEAPARPQADAVAEPAVEDAEAVAPAGSSDVDAHASDTEAADAPLSAGEAVEAVTAVIVPDADDAAVEPEPAGTRVGFMGRVGQGIRSLWGRGRHTAGTDDGAEAGAEAEAEPVAAAETPSAEAVSAAAPTEPEAIEPEVIEPELIEPEVIEPVASGMPAEIFDVEVELTAEAQESSPEPVATATPLHAFDAPPAAFDDGPLGDVFSEPAAAGETEEETPRAADRPRRSFFARRRPKPEARVPRLGSVRVVPREEPFVAPAEPAPGPESETETEIEAEIEAEAAADPSPQPEPAGPRQPTAPPPAGDPGPFTARTWQADTGAWAGLGGHVTTSTWHSGGGPSAQPGAAQASHHCWPSARDILAARATREPASAPRKPACKRPAPTVAREPESFGIPLWLGWPPLALSALAAAVVGVALAWTWSQDARTAGVIADFLARSKPGAKFPLGPEELPEPAWWRSTSGALARRAVAAARAEGSDPEEVRSLLTAASQAAPLDTTARLALARLPVRGEDDAPVRTRSIGLSRDVLSLAWTGSQLVKAGRKESAVRAYRLALELAATADVERLGEPSYDEESASRRYTLPGEDLFGPVIRDMASHAEWAFSDWSAALPDYALASLVAARQVREQDRAGSDALLDRLLGDEGARVAPPGTPAAVHAAARAEAFALRENWAEAQAHYQEAIDLMPLDRVRRSWQFNLADLALRQNDEPARQKALEAANNHDPNDPITLRVVDLQKLSGDGGRRAAGRTRDEAVTRSSRSIER